MNTMNAFPRLYVDEAVVQAVLGDEAVLLHVGSGVYYGLDAVGTRIWELLVQGTTPEGIVATLLDEYDVPADQLRADVAAFLSGLTEKGLVRVEQA